MVETEFLKGEKITEPAAYDFPALKAAFSKDRAEIISDIKESGLKGRGGAGFPTGLKWELAANQESAKKYMICNGDEGEPGTFKDRYLMENRPLKVLEGIILGAYAINAEQGYIYIRGEYSNSIAVFDKIIKKAYEEGVLGENVLGSGFDFDFQLIKGAGAYVCGDETSLLNSIEGKRGYSRIKPPYPVEKGLFSQPTVVNNVETLSAAANIIEQGPSFYSSMGTKGSRGTKLVSLSGDINQPGVYEVEFGQYTVQEIIDDFGGGIKGNRELKFVVPGGISTAVLDKSEIDIPYTYESLEQAGSSLGSGAIIVVAEGHNLIDLMLNVSRFFMDETCGTCFPCREGNRQINRMLNEYQNSFTEEDKEIIKDIGETIRLAARCGLGQSSLNFTKSILDKYESELGLEEVRK
ncbi:MAG: complex I 51 kDa subunit family protein [Bacillota bacterium]